MLKRKDLQIIYQKIKPKSNILDLGCGEGLLLKELTEKKGVNGLGIEISTRRIKKCLEYGISVIQEDLNEGLFDFKTRSFDYVILSQTLEEISNPIKLIKEMLRVGNICIISFENLAYWQNRLSFLISGTFKNKITSNAFESNWKKQQLLTIKKFVRLCSIHKFQIYKKIFISNKKNRFTKIFPNFLSKTAIFFLKSKEG